MSTKRTLKVSYDQRQTLIKICPQEGPIKYHILNILDHFADIWYLELNMSISFTGMSFSHRRPINETPAKRPLSTTRDETVVDIRFHVC
jgi:hypothetical protein